MPLTKLDAPARNIVSCVQRLRYQQTCCVKEVGDDFEAVALINQELLPLGAVVHLLCVFGHQGIEEGIVFFSTLASCTASTCSLSPNEPYILQFW